MALPPGVKTFKYVLDTADKGDFAIVFPRGSTDDDYLQTGETIASFELAERPEAFLAGLRIVTNEPDKAPILSDNNLFFWLNTDALNQADERWNGQGEVHGIIARTVMSTGRIKERTYAVRMAQR